MSSLAEHLFAIARLLQDAKPDDQPCFDLPDLQSAISAFSQAKQGSTLFVVQTGDEPRFAISTALPSTAVSIVSVSKPSGELDLARLVITALPASSFQPLTQMVRDGVGAAFDVLARSSEALENLIASARRKLRDLSLSLQHLHLSIQVPDLALGIHPAVAEAVATNPADPVAALAETLLDDSTFLNLLQATANEWVTAVQRISNIARDVSDGTVKEEVSFYAALETALRAVQTQLAAPGVVTTLAVLRRAKRFHATIGLDSDTGVAEALARAAGANQLLHDLPLGIEDAESVEALHDATVAVFNHLKRIRVSNYPPERAAQLAEAISRDVGVRLCDLLAGCLHVLYAEFESLHATTTALFDLLDRASRLFTLVLREVLRKRLDRHVYVVVTLQTAATAARVEDIARFRAAHEELALAVERVCPEENTGVAAAYSSVSAIDVFSTEWVAALAGYASRTAQLERALVLAFRRHLANAGLSQGMFGVFARFGFLLARPAVVAAVQEYQTQLVQVVAGDLRGLVARASTIPASYAATGTPPVAATILWAKQLESTVDAMAGRLEQVLGASWSDYAAGKALASDMAAFRARLAPDAAYAAWAAAPAPQLAGRCWHVLRRGAGFRLRVAFSPAMLEYAAEVRHLCWLGYSVPSDAVADVRRINSVRPLASALSEAVAAVARVAAEPLGSWSAVVAVPFAETCAALADSAAAEWTSPEAASAFVHLATVLTEAAERAKSWRERTRELLNLVDTCGYSAASLATPRAQLDAVMAEVTAAGLPVDMVRAKVSAHMAARCRRELAALARQDPQRCVLTWLDGVFVVDPPLGQVKQHWVREAGKIVKVAGEDVPDAVTLALVALISPLADAQMFVDRHAAATALFDLSVETLAETLGGNLTEWADLISSATAEHTALDRAASVRRFGGVELDCGPAQLRAAARFEVWLRLVLRVYAGVVGDAISTAVTAMASARHALEQSHDTSTAGGLAAVGSALATASLLVPGWEEDAVVLAAAQRTLLRHRYTFANSWVHADQVASELAGVVQAVARGTHELESSREVLAAGLKREAARVAATTGAIVADWEQQKPGSDSRAAVASAVIAAFQERVRECLAQEATLREAARCIHADVVVPSLLDATRDDLAAAASVWSVLGELEAATASVLAEPLPIRHLRLRRELEDLVTRLRTAPAAVRQYAAFGAATARLRGYVSQSSAVAALSAPEVLRHHLETLWRELGSECPAVVTVGDVFLINPGLHPEAVEAVVAQARGEHVIREALDTIAAVWSTLAFDIVPYGSTVLVSNWEEIAGTAETHLSQLAAMAHSPHRAAFAEECTLWEERLAAVARLADVWAEAQHGWRYLAGVFALAEVRRVVPTEAGRFQALSDEHAALAAELLPKTVAAAAAEPHAVRRMERTVEALARVRRALAQYLEEQRRGFPRFYFLGNDDLLGVLGGGLELVVRHLPAMFGGVANVQHNDGTVHSVVLPEGEVVRLKEAVETSPQPHEWLQALETSLKETLLALVVQAVASISSDLSLWYAEYPGQVGILALQIAHTRDNTQAAARLASLAETTPTTPLLALLRRNLIVELIHQTNPPAVISQGVHLDASLPPLDAVWVTHGAIVLPYAFEYHGVPERLVHTPLTETCFLALATALDQKTGASPFGPAGTGKTELVKAYAQLLGRMCIVFNCDERFDYGAMGRLLAGLAAVGAWGCFDEFNRLETGVLSAVATMIGDVTRGVGSGKVHPHTGVFVTMNPEYAGRTRLPENLRRKFREVSMARPDSRMIARVMLVSQGVEAAEEAAGKVVEVFLRLKSETSQQVHYDWGLRAVKSVVRRVVPTENPFGTLQQALDQEVLPMLVDSDAAVYRDVCRKVLGETTEDLDVAAYTSSATLLGLTSSPLFSTKCSQLASVIGSHTGTILLGAPGSGKSALLRTVAAALTPPPRVVTIDCNLVPLARLFGSVHATTREWLDGVLTAEVRRVVEDLRGEALRPTWLVLDGTVDPAWVENLNLVLDDNRVWTLPTGEHLPMPESMRIIIETDSLETATPATVSRCGVVYIGKDSRNRLAEVLAPEVAAVVGPAWLSAVELDIPHIMEWSEEQALERMRHAGDSVLSAVYAMAWAISGDSTHEGRQAFDEHLRNGPLCEHLPPGPILDYVVTPELLWRPLSPPEVTLAVHEALSPETVVPTVDTLRHEHILEQLLPHQPILLCGPPGCGKTMALLAALRRTPGVVLAAANLSRDLTPALVLATVEEHCRYVRRGGHTELVAHDARLCVVFLDELNLPRPTACGTVLVHEWVRQVAEHGGFWRGGEWVVARGLRFVGACNPPGDVGRSAIAPRLLRRCSVVAVHHPAPPSVKRIYHAMAAAVLKTAPAVSGYAEDLAGVVAELYTQCAARFPAEVYSPRELTRWIRGIHVGLAGVTSSLELASLAAHEGMRLFADRLEQPEDQESVWKIVSTVVGGAFHTNPPRTLYSSWLATTYVPADAAALRAFAAERLRTFSDETFGTPLVATSHLLDHTLRISRVFSQVQGHAMLAGPSGLGRRCAARFAAWLAGVSVVPLVVRRGSTLDDLDAFLRPTLVRSVREPVAILVDESVVDGAYIERLNTLLANAEVPGLFSGEDQGVWVRACTEEAQRRGVLLDGPEEVRQWGTAQVAAHLHVVLVVELGLEVAVLPALRNRCVYNVMGAWTKETIREVVEGRGGGEGTPVLVEAAASVGASGATVAALTETYTDLLGAATARLESHQRTTHQGLDRIKDTVVRVAAARKTLHAQQAVLVEKDATARAVLTEMLADQNEAERKAEASAEIQEALAEQERQIAERLEIVAAALAAAEPAVAAAARGVQDIKKEHLTELRSLARPPEAVRTTIEAVCMLLGFGTGSWRETQTVLRRDDFIASIVQFDSAEADAAARRAARAHYSQLTHDAVHRASKACGPLWTWVDAQVRYAEAVEAVAPLRNEMRGLEAERDRNRVRVAAAGDMLAELRARIDTCKERYAEAIRATEEVKREMAGLQERVDRSVQLMELLLEERGRWAATVAGFGAERAALVGDAAVHAAQLVFGGGDAGSGVVSRARGVAAAHGLAHLSSLLVTYLAAEEQTAEWDALGLDAAGVDSMLVADRATTPYIVDPTGAVLDILGKQPRTTTALCVAPGFERLVENALRFGSRLVVTHAERLDLLLHPLLNREVSHTGGRAMVMLAGVPVDMAPGFRVYLHSEVPESDPYVTARTVRALFAVLESGLASRAVRMALEAKTPEVASRRAVLTRELGACRRLLRSLEELLLATLSDSAGSVVDNRDLVLQLAKLKAEAASVESQMADSAAAAALLEVEVARHASWGEHCGKVYAVCRDVCLLGMFMGVVSRAVVAENLEDALYREAYGFCGNAVSGPQRLAMKIRLARVRGETFSADMTSSQVAAATAGLGNVFSLRDMVPLAPVLLLVLPATSDPTAEVARLAATHNRSLTTVSVGTTEGVAAATTAIADASRAGSWVCVQNVQLAGEWLSSTIQGLDSPDSFRLFATCDSTADLPAPLVALAATVTMDGVVGVGPAVNAAMLWAVPPTTPTEAARIVACVCWVYAVLHERARLAPAGFSKRYDWNDGDVLLAVLVVERWMGKEAHVPPERVPWAELVEVLALAVFGGKVDRDVDVTVVRAVVQRCVCKEVFDHGFKMEEGVEMPEGTAWEAFAAWGQALAEHDGGARWAGLAQDTEAGIAEEETRRVLAAVV